MSMLPETNASAVLKNKYLSYFAPAGPTVTSSVNAVFRTSVAGTFTVPASPSGQSIVTITMVGGGGGGGTAISSSIILWATGGGGGSGNNKTIELVLPAGTVISYTVGSGGAPANPGGATTIVTPVGTYSVAGGQPGGSPGLGGPSTGGAGYGGGGGGGNNAANGLGGAGTFQNGNASARLPNYPGGAGGGIGGGLGGADYGGGGGGGPGGGAGGSGNGIGQNATTYGGGGGGGSSVSSGLVSGGSGFDGYILFQVVAI